MYINGKLNEVEKRYDEVSASLSSPDVANDPKRLMELSKEHKDLQEITKQNQRRLDELHDK